MGKFNYVTKIHYFSDQEQTHDQAHEQTHDQAQNQDRD